MWSQLCQEQWDMGDIIILYTRNNIITLEQKESKEQPMDLLTLGTYV